MTSTEKHIVEVYSEILGNLGPKSKLKLIENLSNSLKTESENKESTFYKSFGEKIPGKINALVRIILGDYI